MPNIGTILKEEIKRLSRRTVRPLYASLKRDMAELKRIVSHQKKAIQKLERDNARLLADLTSRISRIPEASEQEAQKVRLSPRIIRAQRARLGLSQGEFGKLLGVSTHSIFLWEKGKASPRPKVKAPFAAVKHLGRRKARQRLEAMAAVGGNGNRTNGSRRATKKAPVRKGRRKAHAKKA